MEIEYICIGVKIECPTAVVIRGQDCATINLVDVTFAGDHVVFAGPRVPVADIAVATSGVESVAVNRYGCNRLVVTLAESEVIQGYRGDSMSDIID